MKVDMHIASIGTQAIVDKIAQGDLIISPQAVSLEGTDRTRIATALLEQLVAALSKLPHDLVPQAAKEMLITEAKLVAASSPDKDSPNRVEVFLVSLKKCFGYTTDVVTMAVGLARLFAR